MKDNRVTCGMLNMNIHMVREVKVNVVKCETTVQFPFFMIELGLRNESDFFQEVCESVFVMVSQLC